MNTVFKRQRTTLTLLQEDYVLSFYEKESVADMAAKLDVPKTVIYSYLRNRNLDFMRVKGGESKLRKVVPGYFDVNERQLWV